MDKTRFADGGTPVAELRLNLQKKMQDHAAVYRTQESLAEGVVRRERARIENQGEQRRATDCRTGFTLFCFKGWYIPPYFEIFIFLFRAKRKYDADAWNMDACDMMAHREKSHTYEDWLLFFISKRYQYFYGFVNKKYA